MIGLVRDDFKAIGLSNYGVEIHIDDLSKEEIIDSIESENFNSISYLKQDLFNFRKYIDTETFPKHIDYLNNDYAPDLIRFLNVSIGSKCRSYYNFLHRILKDNEDARLLPTFSKRQIDFIDYLSEMLPLVRQHEYIIFKNIIEDKTKLSVIKERLKEEIIDFSDEQLEHAMTFMEKKDF